MPEQSSEICVGKKTERPNGKRSAAGGTQPIAQNRPVSARRLQRGVGRTPSRGYHSIDLFRRVLHHGQNADEGTQRLVHRNGIGKIGLDIGI